MDLTPAEIEQLRELLAKTYKSKHQGIVIDEAIDIVLEGLFGTGIPSGGEEDQVLTKLSDDDFDIGWETFVGLIDGVTHSELEQALRIGTF
ncbi:MAG: hypothetical protein FWC41_00250 [Firmicutes bacterium]|nr:hypothetical protein [Bacillota bacterium]